MSLRSGGTLISIGCLPYPLRRETEMNTLMDFFFFVYEEEETCSMPLAMQIGA